VDLFALATVAQRPDEAMGPPPTKFHELRDNLPQEVRALWLKSMGNSYQEICEATGWSYTKQNRCPEPASDP
jgi:hypothetical protein